MRHAQGELTTIARPVSRPAAKVPPPPPLHAFQLSPLPRSCSRLRPRPHHARTPSMAGNNDEKTIVKQVSLNGEGNVDGVAFSASYRSNRPPRRSRWACFGRSGGGGGGGGGGVAGGVHDPQAAVGAWRTLDAVLVVSVVVFAVTTGLVRGTAREWVHALQVRGGLLCFVCVCRVCGCLFWCTAVLVVYSFTSFSLGLEVRMPLFVLPGISIF